ncbi:multicopper oxidase domain-containing protein [Arthrobacter sp. StoSoilB22]|uniref:multicopper oxidase domain-containing protein n=1 Tax=Arthrobacter sp. StoSoilB22 TaxID=2830996 RepID=UPI001CC5311D|nr:multicopper oxidase domain-containing protein [Arthrobacter sp. StoSoilB22]
MARCQPLRQRSPGETFDYECTLPADHPPGTYWYHPRHHGHAADQVAGCLCGAIVVEDTEPIPVTKERVMVISDLSLDADGNLARPDRSSMPAPPGTCDCPLTDSRSACSAVTSAICRSLRKLQRWFSHRATGWNCS